MASKRILIGAVAVGCIALAVAEATSKAGELFKKVDANHDGVVTQGEPRSCFTAGTRVGRLCSPSTVGSAPPLRHRR